MAKNGESNLQGIQKAAILLIALGPEKSASIFPGRCGRRKSPLRKGSGRFAVVKSRNGVMRRPTAIP